ncbi:hypothetical protein BJX65DRAFT_115455 [Aspergillus insuetus]
MVFGRITHIAFDAVLISAFLAGVKRSTGLTRRTIRLTPFPLAARLPFTPSLTGGVGELSGVRRGEHFSPSLSADKITDSKDIKNWINKYLGVGEWVMDQSVAVLSSTSYFERKR